MVSCVSPPPPQVSITAQIKIYLGSSQTGERHVGGPQRLRPHHRTQRLAEEETSPPTSAPRGPPRHRGDSGWPA